jgi:hypothetical protein
MEESRLTHPRLEVINTYIGFILLDDLGKLAW